MRSARIATALIAFAVAGCGDDESNEESAEPKQQQPAAQQHDAAPADEFALPASAERTPQEQGRSGAAAASLSLVSAATVAARQINGPAWFVCNRYPATISISPPRVWAGYGTEQVLWLSQLQRWDGTRWNNYSQYTTWSSFNYYGQGVTAWTGGRFHNSTLNIPVAHQGYYRVAADVSGNQRGVRWTGFVGGEGANCYIW